MKEDQISGLEPLACTSHMQKGGLPMDSLPLPSGDEKALVLYNPAKMPFYKTPASKDFSIIVNSDLIPGLRGETQDLYIAPYYFVLFAFQSVFN
jgi:hypothetical protein